MPTTYNKLVRDRIPDIIQASGHACEVVTMPEAEYRQALLKKLLEEAREVEQADSDHIVTELADLYEVVDAILLAHGIDPASVRAEQQRRRVERGGFEKRLRLVWAE